jgi:phage gpG-like protein
MVQLETVGLEEVLKKLGKLEDDDLHKARGAATQAAAHATEGFAKANIRRYKETENKLIRTANMLNSVQVAPDGDDAWVYVGAEYGVYHEMGAPGANIPPRPYLWPGYNEHRDDIAKASVEAAKKVIGK